MAMPVQFGDLVAFTKIAIQVYEFGWSKSYRANTQYAAFGKFVKTLSDNSRRLLHVVQDAENTLQYRNADLTEYSAYDTQSLGEIVGDVEGLLEDCNELLRANRRYQGARGVIDNIEWNVSVQPAADRLVSRIMQHNARIEHFLRPFEIDVRTRMWDHIMRTIDGVQATADRIEDLLLRLIRNSDPELYSEIKSEEARKTHTVPIPRGLRTALEFEFENHPDRNLGCPSLQAMANSFVANFDKSTKDFRSGPLPVGRTPPMLQYVCLLKSVFLMEKIMAAHDLHTCPTTSHWRTYIKQLENDLSTECLRFQREMLTPASENVPADMITLWVKDEPEDPFDTIAPQLLMDELLNCSLVVPRRRLGTKKLTLLRHTESHDERFRLIITTTDDDGGGVRAINTHQKVVDFDIRNAHLKPQYAMPGGYNEPVEMILRANSEIISLVFEQLANALEFQQGLTGFRPWNFYAGYVPKVSFYTNGRNIGVAASLQLWVPDRLVGSPRTSAGRGESAPAVNIGTQAPVSSSSASIPERCAPRSTATSPVDYLGVDFSHLGLNDRDPASRSITSSPQQYTNSTFPSIEVRSPSPALPVSIPRQGRFVGPSPTRRTPAGQGAFFDSQMSESPPRVADPGVAVGLSPPSQATPSLPPSRGSSLFSRSMFSSRRASRATTIGSSTSVQPPGTAQSTSSSTSETAVSIKTKNGALNGILHVEPTKPMMVMFTEDVETGSLSIVMISIDNGLRPVHERCNCQRADAVGRDCPVTAIEQLKGTAPIDAKLLGPYLDNSDVEWDVLKLAAARRGDPKGFGGSDWYGLQRVSIGFSSPRDRFELAGCMCLCSKSSKPFKVRDETNCMQLGHVGLLGEVRIKFRRDLQAYHNVINGLHDQVVNRAAMNDFY